MSSPLTKYFLQNIFLGVAKKRKVAYHCGMETHEAIQKAGSAVALAKLLGITRQAISQWGDTVPQARLWQLRALRPKWFKG
jgi:transcriptional repressor of cell division inhibition gene dicB